MKTTLRSIFAISALALMAACGGGSGVSSVPAPTPAPTAKPATPATTAAPKSNATADLVSFAKGGTKSVLRDDVLRVSRDYKGGSVAYDTVAGASVGLVTAIDKNGTAYRVSGSAKPNITVGSGTYNGPMQMTYSTTANGPKQTAKGDMIVGVEFKDGMAYTGGIASNQNNVIEIFGDAKIQNGRIIDNATKVRLRDGEGNAIRDYAGTTNGVLVNGANGRDAIIGTLGSTGLNMTGGFVVNENK